MAKRNSDEMDFVHAHALARRRKTAGDHAVEDTGISEPHDARRAHRAAWAGRHDRLRLPEMLACALDYGVAGSAEIGMRGDRSRIGGVNAGARQGFARQIEPANARVLVDVAEDVGQLQRASEVMCEISPGLL